MYAISVVILTLFISTQASPISSKLKVDQAQEGKWNLRADLKNFIIMIIPSFSSSNKSILDYISKSIPSSYRKDFKKKINQQEEEIISDTEQFLESKTAPYHVDISHMKTHLTKLHPEISIPEAIKEKIIVARSPSVALTKNKDVSDESERTARAYLMTVPIANNNVQIYNKKDIANNEDGKKRIHLSEEAIEKGLAEEMNKNNIESSREESDLSLGEFKLLVKNIRTHYATILADTIKRGLIAYFKNVTAELKEKQESKKEHQEQKAEKLEKPEKKKVGVISSPKLELEPPKMQIKDESTTGKKDLGNMKKYNENRGEANKETHKEELLLLGAVNEQCGPGQERDSSGICVIISKT